MEHTKTPWYGNGRAIVTAFCQKEICLCHAEDEFPEDIAYANAAFIVRAVNAHEKLVEALRNVSYFRTGKRCWCEPGRESDNHEGQCLAAREDLALAEK